MITCDRCYEQTSVTIMSMFNTEILCMECKQKEKLDPRYKQAQAADDAAIRAGNFNFKGIGK